MYTFAAQIVDSYIAWKGIIRHGGTLIGIKTNKNILTNNKS